MQPDGSKINTLIDQLDSALREAGIERSSFAEKYYVHSLRHFYALKAPRNGVGVFEVARNMGTSVQIIQEYYGKQATAAVFATRGSSLLAEQQRAVMSLKLGFRHVEQ